jgi:fermentation-respiration switch protein FrsA (DUF1100 family)
VTTATAPPPRARRRFFVALTVSLAVSVAVAVLIPAWLVVKSALFGLRLAHLPRAPVPPDEEAEAFAAIPHLEKVVLHTSDGLSLQGWFAPGTRRAALAFVHGSGANRLMLLPDARALARHGYGFLVYDSRACGESEGELATWGDRERLDLRAAIDFLSARPDVDPARIGAAGFSVGASTVVLEAADDARLHAVVLYATSTSLEDEFKTNESRYGPLSWGPELFELRSQGVNVGAVRPIDVIGRIQPRPLLMIAGESDHHTPVAEMKTLFEAAGAPKDLWIVPLADHGGAFAAAPADYESRVTAFLESAFAGR